MTSIEFRPVGTFASPLFSTQKSARRAAADGVVAASAFLFVPQKGCLFVGLTDGKILCWETDRLATDRRGKDSAPRVFNEHRGDVRCMIFVESHGQGVMFTGSADRTIKMWDMANPRSAIPCVRTLCGHGGTILALEFVSELLLSTSTDGLLCVWKDPAKLLRFPTYSICQKISPDGRAGQQGARAAKETWFVSVAIREGEQPTIFGGDSEGYVHIYKPDPAMEGDQDHCFVLAWKKQIHELGISNLLAVPMETFLFTTAWDQKFKTLDSLSGQVIFQENNQCGVNFSAFAWDPVSQDVIVADDKGNIGFYNLYTETCVAWRNLARDPIIQAHYEPTTHRLLLLSGHALRVVDVVQGVKLSELNEHMGPVVAMVSRPTPQGGLLYTAAGGSAGQLSDHTDNTIRMWDADALECIKCLKDKKHEITAMVYLPRANVIITGHENSDLKMWSIDSQAPANLRTVSGQTAHGNTISALVVATAGAGPEDSAEEGGDAAVATGWETLVAGSYDRQLSFWKVMLTCDGTAMAKFERVYTAHEEPDDEILAIACGSSATGNSVFSGGNAGVIRQWAFWGSRQLEAEYEGHEDAVVAFAVDAHFLYSGSVDCTVRIWETSQGYELKCVRLHGVSVQALLVIQDTGWVASCGNDGKVLLWDPQVGNPDVAEVASYEQHEQFCSLAFVELSRTLLVGCESGKIVAFPLPAAGASDGEEGSATVAAAAVPPVLSGMTTPPSARDDVPGALEALRAAEKLAKAEG